MSPVSASTPYPTKSNQRPEKFAGDPCVRWPPKGSPIARTVSPGRSSAAYAARTAEDPRVGLHVGVLGAEERLGPVDGDPLGDVDDLAAAVVAGAGIPLGVLVRERRPERGQHGRRGEVLGRDQLQRRRLPLQLPDQDLGELRVLPTQNIRFQRLCDRHGGLRTSAWGCVRPM